MQLKGMFLQIFCDVCGKDYGMLVVGILLPFALYGIELLKKEGKTKEKNNL